jgi:hypothetical protein
MPFYLFKNPITKEIVEVFQAMKDEHIFIDSNGIEYERIYTIPQASIDSKIDAFSSSDFVEKTRNKKGTIGDLWQASRELSEKRGGSANDPVKEKFYKNYAKEHGVKHADQIKKEKKDKAKENLKKLGFSL